MKTPDTTHIHITTEKDKLDMDAIMDFMHRHSYWAQSRDRATMSRAIENSLCFGLFYENRMAGFARVVTDYSTMYYLCDVFIQPVYQGRGLGKQLIQAVIDAPQLSGLYGMLLTRDAHELYRSFGFSDEEEALKKFMIKRDWSY